MAYFKAGEIDRRELAPPNANKVDHRGAACNEGKSTASRLTSSSPPHPTTLTIFD